MDQNESKMKHRDVEDLLLPDESGKNTIDIESELRKDSGDKPKKILTGSTITVIIVAVLAALSLIVIYSNDNLSEQFDAILKGELGKYKEELRKVQEDRIREIEDLTGNKYGSVTLFYSPQDAQVMMKQMKYTKDCSSFAANEEDVLLCLKKPFDYTQKPEVKEIDNKSLHLDKEKKEIVDSLPFNDMPIQEANEERTIVDAFEVEIEIIREGYDPRKFHFTGDKNRIGVLGEGWESKYWDQKGPGIFMVDFQGADLNPKPETAKNNYMAAVKEMECIKREVAAKREAGKTVNQDTVNGVYSEILNKHEFKTVEEYNTVDNALHTTQPEWYEGFWKEVEKMPCAAAGL
ncbi:MAG TPA: hypothetical protein PKG82_02475 [Myxococcota bacterium]|nr:hypothetical protein [Myxococcota bacterium]